MNFTDWTAKAVEERVLDMADTLRKVPAVKGPKVYGSAMPEVVRRHEEAYGANKTRCRKSASSAELSRMEEVWAWINALPGQSDRELLYTWSFVKVRKGWTISHFAEENDMNERTLRRAVTAVCQRVADDLNRRHQARLSSPYCLVSETAPSLTSTKVSSQNCVNEWRASDAKPQIDPSLPKSRVLEPRNIRARHSDRNRSLGAR